MPDPDAFHARYGFSRDAVSLANWRAAPFSRWSFQNVRELVPSAAIASGGAPDMAVAPPADALLAEAVTTPDTAPETLGAFLRRSSTDILLVLKDGRPLAAWAAPHADLDRPHLLFSISKSLTALLAGALAARGALDLEAPIAAVLPEAEGSAYGGDATLRHLLDMRLSLDFEESYLDATGGFARYRRATLWNPPDPSAEPESLLDFVLTIRKGEGPHGGPFRYRSPNSDLLGAVVERAGGKRFADLARELLWEPMGLEGEAYVTVDREGTARAAGGMVVTARDLALIGEMMRQGGAAGAVQVLPEAFVRDTLLGGDPQAFRNGDSTGLLPRGSYRNKWYATNAPSGSFCAIGIHGQWLFVDPSRAVTIVRLSSQPEPQDERLDRAILAVLDQIAERV